MQLWLVIPLGLLLLAGCSFSSMPAQRPADFSVAYNWQEGSLPPPYHYEYSITITGNGQGDVVMTPSYPAEHVPRWQESFQVTAADLDRLYQRFVDQGLFTHSWKTETNLRVGGSSEWIKVVAGETVVEIPRQVVAGQEAAATEIYAAVKALVPPAQWAKLETQLKEYQDSHQP